MALWTLRTLLPWTVGAYRNQRGAASVLRQRYDYRSETRPAVVRARRPAWRRTARDAAARPWPHRAAGAAALRRCDQHGARRGVAPAFLDYRLVELVMPVASSLKIHRGESKWPIREFLRRHRLPIIADRVDKKGYVTPIERWMTANNGRLLRETLLGGDAAILQWVDPARVGRLIDLYVGGASDSWNHLFRLLSAEFWLEECIATSASPRLKEAA